ncbi:hypothetical protein IT6_03140 [Methylacidiphilum caldifontis]|uniref:hypothetical protein n=1 Tax=Methylacidiphilum caldifontis TaxID=2795386 RepID=UPI001A8DB442|nr:hypothetical protein [Methylacidiphilum caldifontis]QSR89292.1 hypothetical protein IT6_03140 [Methylacidiphilum caldifontis]
MQIGDFKGFFLSILRLLKSKIPPFLRYWADIPSLTLQPGPKEKNLYGFLGQNICIYSCVRATNDGGQSARIQRAVLYCNKNGKNNLFEHKFLIVSDGRVVVEDIPKNTTRDVISIFHLPSEYISHEGSFQANLLELIDQFGVRYSLKKPIFYYVPRDFSYPQF